LGSERLPAKQGPGDLTPDRKETTERKEIQMADRYYDRDWDRNYYYGRDYYDPYFYDPYYYKNGYYNPFYYNWGYAGSPYSYYEYWDHPYYDYGEYSGYGPSGYTRPADRIQDDVNDRLTWHSGIDATDIHVSVNDGMVTLTGSVDTRPDKRLARDIADAVPGVWDVDNQLTVRNRRRARGQSQRSQTHVGMEVVDNDGKRVGTVRELRSNGFLVERGGTRDVYISFTACDVYSDQVHLNVHAEDVDNQGRQIPEKVAAHRNR
jgi:hypothetical protein